MFFNLAKCDCKLSAQPNLAKQKMNYSYPDAQKKKVQSQYIQQLQKEQEQVEANLSV
jgi:hypothetical protein